jgi:hypothetical protein
VDDDDDDNECSIPLTLVGDVNAIISIIIVVVEWKCVELQ